MKFTIEIKDEHISSIKYVLMGVFVVLGIGYVYFTQMQGITLENGSFYLMLATIFAIYMAVNLGANDVANNMGPAVGSKALTLGGAIVIAVIFEASGALIAGGDVVDTIKGGIIDSSMIDTQSKEFIAIMLSTLLGAAIWVNTATFLKAPVSITHAIFGGLIGAGVTSSGIQVVQWGKVGSVALAWIIAIFMGALIATLLYISIKKKILKQKNRGEAAKHRVPVYVGLMAGIFSLYLILKGFKNKLSGSSFEFLLDKPTALFISIIIAAGVYIMLIIHYKKQAQGFFIDSKNFIRSLFNIPLIFAVALLSFAHGANDVANAIGPLAAINEAVKTSGDALGKIGVPFWIMLLGALSLSIGLATFGGRLIKTVGNEITKLDQIKAYCVALSAAITVIFASALSLPVSTTQIAIGGVFGIGLYREHVKRKEGKHKVYIKKSMIKTIVLSWIITLPISGVISSITYFIIIVFA